jgi:hypothetical protein
MIGMDRADGNQSQEMHMEQNDDNGASDGFLIRFLATDWDAEIVAATNEYLASIEPDCKGRRPSAWMDEPVNRWLGVHIFPLEEYSPERRQEIAATCLHLRNVISYGLTYGQKKPFEV